MGLRISLFLFAVLFLFESCSTPANTTFEFQEGDIILQALNSPQCDAIRLATDNYYSHCGMVVNDGKKLMIYEAIGPVKKTEIQEFTASGINGHYVVMRLKDSTVDHQSILNYCDGELGKAYDIYFNWDDTEIYCSEFVWKAYEASQIELCNTRPLKDYDLSSPLVQTILQERYAPKIPYGEPMVAPSDLYSSGLLEIVYQNKK
ncbi:MAG: peptidoglycan peptidase [Flavobacteriales bacterium]|nr:peptidoglycan peptidase [Flavobacteriales bacterium]